MKHARSIVRRVCDLAGDFTCLDRLRDDSTANGLAAAVHTRDTPVIFDWLMRMLSYQGISDTVATGYIERNGNIAWAEIVSALAAGPECGKLKNYWAFTGCQYHKGLRTCAEPDHFDDCPLPRHALRNGRLNQTAYSLFLFIRDTTGNDIVGWIDAQIKDYPGINNVAAARAALVDPLRHVYGVSDKVIGLALTNLMMGAGASRPGWFEAGASIVVVDTLVHKFLVRTGILKRLGASHPYGPACYRTGGCADVLIAIAATIDARNFNSSFPKVFPRFVQHSIWQYCGQSALNICNGNQIADASQCTNMWCELYTRCDRLPLRITPTKPEKHDI